MYINFKLLKVYSLTYNDLIFLQMCRQNKLEDLSEDIENMLATFSVDLDKLSNEGYITFIKGNSKQKDSEKIRVSKKGSDILDNIEIPEITPEDLTLFTWLEKLYGDQGKEIGNKKKTKMYLALFRVNSGIEKNELATLLDEFTRDSDNMNYNHKLEYAFFKPSSVYQTRFELDQSRLWGYYEKNKDRFDQLFKEIRKNATKNR